MMDLKSYSMFKLAFEKAENPIIISSIYGKYIFANKSYLNLRKSKENRIIGKSWWDTFKQKEKRKLLKEHFRITVRKKKYEYLFEYENEKKEQVIISWISQVIYCPEYDGEFIFEVGNNVTNEIKLKSQLVHVQKLDSLGILASGIAHEFNNILTSIIGYSSFLKNYFKKDSKEKEYISKIQNAALNAAGLTSKLLGFSRKGKYLEKLININLIVKEVSEIVKATFNKNIEVNVNINENMYYVLADHSQVYQSIMNLLINSKDAMKKDGILTISTDVIEYKKDKKFKKFVVNKGLYVLLKVTDTGMGMNESVKKKMFEPFFTTKILGQGTGLGLYMVYTIVKSHKGYIFVYSKKGKGTSIEIILPAVSLIREKIDSEDSGSYPVINHGKDRSILIVDDDDEILNCLETVLFEYGYNVLKAKNGKEALEIFARNVKKLELLVIDIFIPVLDGRSVIEKVKEIKPDLKIVVITSFSEDKIIDQVKSLGVNYFLFKPFKVSSLINVLSGIFKKD